MQAYTLGENTGATVRSTINAIKLVTDLVENAIHGKDGISKYHTVITLDDQNAFNSNQLNLIKRSLATFDVSGY